MDSETGAAQRLRAKVVLLGDAGVGKSALIRRFERGEFSDAYERTVGVRVRPVRVPLPHVGPVPVDLLLLDTMGDRRLLDGLRDVLFGHLGAALAVCRVGDPPSVASIRAWIRAFVPGGAESVLANQSDRAAGPGGVEAALRAARDLATPLYVTSARDGTNVTRAFRDLAVRVAARSLFPSRGPLDAASEGIVIDASARPRSSRELADLCGPPFESVLARVENLVRRGYLRAASVDVGPDGLPDVTYAATGKSFPPLPR